MTKTTPIRRGSPLARPSVYIPLAIAGLAIAGLVAKSFAASAAAGAERTQLIADIDHATQQRPVDGSELSRLVARLQKLPDHDSARDLLAAGARIELARDRAERAFALFGTLASQPGATPAEQRLGATILLRWHETGGGGDRAAAAGLLQQVVAFSEAAYQDGHDPLDLMRAWQAETRLSRVEPARAIGKRIVEAHADSPAAQLVQLAQKFEPGMAREVESVTAAFEVPPVELEAMRVLVVLQGGAVERAVSGAETLLRHAPGVVTCRLVAVSVFHVCMISQAEGSAERQRWAADRNVHLDWLLERAPVEDPRREQWAKTRAEN